MPIAEISPQVVWEVVDDKNGDKQTTNESSKKKIYHGVL